MAADFDSPWKEALDEYFEAFLLLLYPQVHRDIDWSRRYESLDKEFQQIVREAEVGRRYVDKLVRVWERDGTETWVLIHVEVQTSREAEFAERMYVYNYRVFDRYNLPVVSLAVLADDDRNWRPGEYRAEKWGCTRLLTFVPAKLLDFAGRVDYLEASDNPFAKVVLAHLKALETRDSAGDREVWKIRLVRGLYQRGFTMEAIRRLFRLIDWLMELPPVLDSLFRQELAEIEEENRMPYITSVERLAKKEGQLEGMEAVLDMKFGAEGLALLPEIQAIDDLSLLKTILMAVKTASSIEELRRLWTPSPSEGPPALRGGDLPREADNGSPTGSNPEGG